MEGDPRSGQQAMHIEYEVQVDPKGSIPAWVVNMFSTKGCFSTFKKLKQIIIHT